MLAFFSNKNKTQIAPSSIIFAVFFILSLYLLYLLKSVVVLVFLSFIVMIALTPLVNKFEHYLKLPKIPSMIAAYILALTIFGITIALVVPPLLKQLFELVSTLNIPVDIPILNEQLRYASLSVQEINSIIGSVGDSFNWIMNVINTTFSGVLTFFMVLVLSFYMKLERDDLHKKLYWFTNNKQHIKTAKAIIDEIELQMGGWVRAQLLLMITVGVATYIGLLILGVPYALPLAIIAGFLEVVPNIGPVISAVPAVFLGFISSGWIVAGFIALFYALIQQLENSVLVPKVMRSRVNVSPLVTLVLILSGLTLSGIPGALLSIPSYIVIRVMYDKLWRPKVVAAS